VAKFRQNGDADDIDLRELMGRMQDWFPESDAPVSATLDGEPVTRVTGRLNLTEALKDLNGMSEQPGMKSLKAVDKEKIVAPTAGKPLAELGERVVEDSGAKDVVGDGGPMPSCASRCSPRTPRRSRRSTPGTAT